MNHSGFNPVVFSKILRLFRSAILAIFYQLSGVIGRFLMKLLQHIKKKTTFATLLKEENAILTSKSKRTK